MNNIVLSSHQLHDIIDVYQYGYSASHVRDYMRDEHSLDLKTAHIKNILRCCGIPIRRGRPTFQGDGINQYVARQIEANPKYRLTKGELQGFQD